jgi:hypothetical protein
MLTRREVLRNGLLTILYGVCAPGRQAEAQTPGRGTSNRGCILLPGETAHFMSSATEPQLFVTGKEPIISKSQDPAFDFALAHTLARLSEVMSVLPGFAYYDDRDAPNALATREVRLGKSDGTVLFGQEFLRRMLAVEESPEVAVAAVCAHEFGHILQFKRGLDRRLIAGEPTVKKVELNADFFAGFFAGVRKLERPTFPAAVFALTQYNLGDTEFASRHHHGTPEERGRAITRGFEVAYDERRTLEQAIEVGLAYALAA